MVAGSAPGTARGATTRGYDGAATLARVSGRGPRKHGDAATHLADDLASPADYYGILGLRSDATLADVKKAYRKLARQHHPDRNNADPGAIDRFRRITEAYEYLSPPEGQRPRHRPPQARPGRPAEGRRRHARRVLRGHQPRADHAGRDLAGHPCPPSRDSARRHHHRQRHHRPGRQMGPLRPPAVDGPHHRHSDKDPSHSDRPSHASSRVVRRTSTSPMADAAVANPAPSRVALARPGDK